jgi:hypothetical protein
MASPISSLCGYAEGLLVVVENTGEGRCQSSRIGRRYKYAAFPVFDDLRNASGARSDDGSVRQHPFDQNAAERLGCYGGVRYDVDKAHDIGDVHAESNKVNPVRQIHRIGLPTKALCISILPKQGSTDEQGVDAW